MLPALAVVLPSFMVLPAVFVVVLPVLAMVLLVLAVALHVVMVVLLALAVMPPVLVVLLPAVVIPVPVTSLLAAHPRKAIVFFGSVSSLMVNLRRMRMPSAARVADKQAPDPLYSLEGLGQGDGRGLRPKEPQSTWTELFLVN